MTNLQALNDFNFLKGLSKIFHTSYFDQISPIHGAKMLASNEMKNRRFFGNYSTKNPIYTCLDGTRNGELLLKNNDCPQDPLSEWLQKLFPSPDGVNFVVNQINTDPASKLTPQKIGSIFSELIDINDEQFKDDKFVMNLTRKIEGIISEQYQSQINEIQSSLKDKNKKLVELKIQGHCGSENYIEIEEEINKLTKIFDHLVMSKTFDVNKMLQNPTERNNKASEFANILVGAIKFTRSENSFYPKYLPEHILLGFLLMKYPNKNAIVEFIRGFKPQQLTFLLQDPEFLNRNNLSKQNFLREFYQVQDFMPTNLKLDPFNLTPEFYNDPAFFIYVMEEIEKINLKRPNLISYSHTRYQKSDETPISFSNCGEVSAWNFFNQFLFDQESCQLSMDGLQKNSILKVKDLHPKLIEFYQIYSSPQLNSTQKAHDAWTQVVSELEGVNYARPQIQGILPYCEIKGGLNNMLKVLSHLILPIKNCSDQLQTNSQKLSRICELFSTSKKNLTWQEINCLNPNDLDEQNNQEYNILFSQNNDPYLIWRFMPHHFLLEYPNQSLQNDDESDDQNDLKNFKFIVYRELIKLLDWGKQQKLKKAEIDFYLPLLITDTKIYAHYFNDGPEIPLLQNLSQQSINQLIFSSHFGSYMDLLYIFNLIIERGHNQISILNTTLDKIIDILPLDDQHGLFMILDILIKNNFPHNKIQKIIIKYPDSKKRIGFLGVKYEKWDFINFLTEKFPESLQVNNYNHGTPLHEAIKKNIPLDLLIKLTKLFPKIFTSLNSSEEDLIFLAAEFKNWEALDYFKDTFPLSFSRYNRFGDTILHLMVPNAPNEIFKKYVDFFKELERKNSLPELNNPPPQGDFDPAYLMNQFSNLNYKNGILKHQNNKSETIAHKAAKHSMWDNFLTLISLDPEIISITDENKSTPFHNAFHDHLYYANETYPSSLLIRKIFDLAPEQLLKVLKMKNKSGNNPVHLAAYKDQWDQVKTLIEIYPDYFRNPQNSGILNILTLGRFKEMDLDFLKALISLNDSYLNYQNRFRQNIFHIIFDHGFQIESLLPSYWDKILYLIEKKPSALMESNDFSHTNLELIIDLIPIEIMDQILKWVKPEWILIKGTYNRNILEILLKNKKYDRIDLILKSYPSLKESYQNMSNENLRTH